MGADVRPCVPEDLIVDQKARVYSSPGFLAEGARLPSVARAVDRLVRAVVGNARDRAPASAQQLDPFDVTGVSPTDRGRGSA
jgi:enhancing lycopene biosynthesis protein 2